jgi:isopenicillin-N N-acyltransferase-like protein
MGQNLDTAEIAQGLVTLLRVRSESAPEALIVAQPGSLGSIGLNRSPLGVCVNTINLKSNRNGLPLQFISRALLEKDSLSEAVRFLHEIVPGAAQNFMVGDSEQVLDFELSGNKVVPFTPHAGARRVWHTNHHLANDDIIPDYFPIAPDSLERYRYFEFRLGDPAKPIRLENVQGILRSHLAPICYHGWGKPETTRTWVSVIYELADSPALYLALGNPCEHDYQRFDFAS